MTKSVKYNGEQTLSIDGHIIVKGHNEVPEHVHAKMQNKAWQEQHGGAKHFEFAAAQKPIGGKEQKPLGPKDTNSFGTNQEIADKQVARDLAPDTDIPGDSEQKMVGGSEDQKMDHKAQHSRTSEGKINTSKSSSKHQ